MLYAEKGQLSELRETPRSTAPDVVKGQLRYNVFALGTRGSGKTVFLACLHRRLAIQHPENRFTIKCEDPAVEEQLNAIYGEIVSPGAQWPPGTSVMSDYEFQCRHRTADGPVSLFRMAYSDYPGGGIDGSAQLSAEEKATIREKTAKAHSLIVLIDGQKVLQSIEERPGARNSLYNDLYLLIARLTDGVAKPVIFLLTKCDVLDDRTSLLDVRRELFTSPDFRSFVETQREFGLPLHLIPVSAVGRNFAKLNREKGVMEKITDGYAFPLNLEFALGCTVINQFKLYEDDRNNKGLVAKARKAGLWIWDKFGRALDEFQIPGSPVSISFRRVLACLRVNGVPLDEQILELLKRRVVDQKAAIETVFELMAARMADLKVKEPATDLIARLEN